MILQRVSFSILSVLLFFVISWGQGSSPALAAEKSFYEGKTVRIIVPFNPGGGFDMLARFLARHMPKYISGKPKFIVQSMPGGGGLIGPNFLYNAAKPDGLTIGIVHGSATISQMKKVSGLNFKMEKFGWIGGIDLGPVVVAVKKDLPYRNIDDLRNANKTIFFAGSVSGSISNEYPLILKKYGGLNFKVISGYRGLSSAIASMQRGETEARSGSLPSLRRNSDTLRIIIGPDRARSAVPNIIIDSEIVKSKEGRRLINALQIPQRIGRGIIAPPKVPQGRMEILRSAWGKLMGDPIFLKKVEKLLLVKQKDLTTAKEIKDVIAQVRSLPEQTWDLLKALGKK